MLRETSFSFKSILQLNPYENIHKLWGINILAPLHNRIITKLRIILYLYIFLLFYNLSSVFNPYDNTPK